MQYYTKKRPENARVENGHLILEARLDSVEIDGMIHPLTSASLITKGLAEWQYGRIEVKAKIPVELRDLGLMPLFFVVLYRLM